MSDAELDAEVDTLTAWAREQIRASQEEGVPSGQPWMVIAANGVFPVSPDGTFSLSPLHDRGPAVLFTVEAASAIFDSRDRLKAEAAALEGMLADLATDSLAAARALELAERALVLEDALRPFATWCVSVDFADFAALPDASPLPVLAGPRQIRPTVGDLRRAAKVMEGTP